MRSEMLKNNYSHIVKAIELIEEGIAEKLKPTEISRKLEAEIMLSYKYFNEVFNATTGYTLAQYIRRRALAVIYETWKKERPALCKTSTYEGYPRFPDRFYTEYELTIEAAAEKGVTAEQLQSKLDITNHVRVLEALDEVKESKLLEDYTFSDKQKIMMEFSIEKVLLLYLQMPVYLLPGACYEIYKSVDDEAKATYVIAFDQLAHGLNHENLVETTYMECKEMQTRLLNYDFDKVGDILIVKPMEKEGLKQAFLDKCDELVPYMFSVLPDRMIPPILAKRLAMVEECESIELLAKALKLSLAETKELLWKFMMHGYLRAGGIK